jgi:hypothetical protein
MNTFGDLFALVYFRRLFLNKFVALLANLEDVCACDTRLLDLNEDSVTDIARGLQFSKRIWIGERIVLDTVSRIIYDRVKKVQLPLPHLLCRPFLLED